MQIEDAIKQKKPFKNERHRAIINLLYTTNMVRDRNKSILKEFGLTMQQYNVLRILRGAGKPISTRIIRQRLLDKMADASRLVDRITQKNLVERTSCANDKRLVDVSLSEEGEALLLKIDNKHPEMYDLLGSLTEEEAKILNNLLDKVRLD
ncbi:MAG: DNA-binding MarR family transcriptional regulator [Paraglaciecola sp.]|jgi:DNA-binding MarR family transcriptional regulator